MTTCTHAYISLLDDTLSLRSLDVIGNDFPCGVFGADAEIIGCVMDIGVVEADTDADKDVAQLESICNVSVPWGGLVGCGVGEM